MRTLTIADNWKDWKFGDTDAVMTFTALDDDKVPDFSDRTLTFKIASTLNNDLEHPKDFAATAAGYIQDKNVILKTEDVKQLTPGNYIVELWAMSNDTQKDAVYPSKGFAQFTIEENSMKVSDVTNIPSMTINAFWNAVMQKVGTLTKGAKGDPGQTPKIVMGSVTKLSPDAQPSATLVPLQSDPNTYTLNLQLPQGVQGEQGLQGIPGVGSKGLDGNNGLTPTIDPKTKHWMIGGTDTGVIAEGQAGKDADPSKYVTIVSFNQLRQQVQDNATALAQKAGKFELEDKLAQMSLEPEAFENEAALKAKYPNGKPGLMVTADTGHKWLWIQGAWKDCGIYQSAGIAAGIKYDKLDDTLKGAFLPNVEEIPVVGNHPGYISKQDGKVVPTNNYYHSDALSVMPGEEYRIKGRTYYDSRTVILENGDGKIVQTYPNDSADQEVTFGFTVPQGASRMIINYNSFTPTRILKILNYNRNNAAWANLNQITFTQKADTYIPIKLEENLKKGYWDYKREGAFSVNKDSSASYKPIAVKPFEVYRVTGQSKYDAKLATLIDYDGNMIQAVPNSDNQAGTFNIVIPWNAAFILINNYTGIATKLEKATSFSNPMEDTQNRLNKALLDFKKSNYDFEGIQLSYTQQGFWDRNGRFTESNYIDSTDKIPVSSFDVYRIKGYTYLDSNLYQLLDANGSIVDIYPNTSEDLKKYENTFIIPDNAQFLVINHYKGYDVTLEKATNLSKSILPTTGKKWIAIGDSWTAVGTLGNGIDNYTNYVAKRLGLNMDNAAIGGTGYVAHNKNANDQFYNREIAADGDAYTILGSFNDVFVDGFNFGDVGNTDKLSLWGGMKATIDHIYSVKDNARIGIIAPGPWGAFNPQNGSNWDKLSMKASEVGEQYVATMKKFADYYSLPFLDLYHQSNLRPWDSDYVKKYFHGDNTHPNTEGHKQFAPIIADFVNRLL